MIKKNFPQYNLNIIHYLFSKKSQKIYTDIMATNFIFSPYFCNKNMTLCKYDTGKYNVEELCICICFSCFFFLFFFHTNSGTIKYKFSFGIFI